MKGHHFNDENTLEDIYGCIVVLQLYPSHPDFPPIAVRMGELIARIEDKMARNKNRIRHRWFGIALDFAKQARLHYEANDLQIGESFLRKCEDYLRSGNKAHRRKAAFLVGTDGVAHPVNDEARAPTQGTKPAASK